jgi:hypothetical protein
VSGKYRLRERAVFKRKISTASVSGRFLIRLEIRPLTAAVLTCISKSSAFRHFKLRLLSHSLEQRLITRVAAQRFELRIPSDSAEFAAVFAEIFFQPFKSAVFVA